MSVLEVPVPILQPAEGTTAWLFILIGIACAVVLSAGYLARLWRSDHYRGQNRYRPTDSPQPYSNQGDERVSGA